MLTQRKRYIAKFKATAAIEALKGQRLLDEIGGELGVHSVQLSRWKKTAVDGLPDVFAGPQRNAEVEALQPQLYQQIGQLKMEVDWLKKNLAVSHEDD